MRGVRGNRIIVTEEVIARGKKVGRVWVRQVMVAEEVFGDEVRVNAYARRR